MKETEHACYSACSVSSFHLSKAFSHLALYMNLITFAFLPTALWAKELFYNKWTFSSVNFRLLNLANPNSREDNSNKGVHVWYDYMLMVQESVPHPIAVFIIQAWAYPCCLSFRSGQCESLKAGISKRLSTLFRHTVYDTNRKTHRSRTPQAGTKRHMARPQTLL